MRSLARVAVLSTVFGLLGGGIGYLLLPERAPEAAGIPRIRVRGQPVSPGRDTTATAHAIARAYLREHVTLRAGGHTIERTREGFGARVDTVLLAHLLSASTDPNSALRRHHAVLSNGPIELPLPVRMEGAVAMPLLMQLKEQVDHLPADARIDVEHRRVIPERNGTWLDVYGTLARLDDAFASGQRGVDAVVDEVAPALTAAHLHDVDMRAVVGWFQTNYNAREDHRDRTYNLHLAAERINGYVWMPGQVLDFNQIVGDRSEANGFKMATVISAGELIDGVGGGTCQIAGTLYAASFFAGMQMVERTPHTRPSGYIKMGLDATVVYPSINLRMRNNLPFPLVVHTHLDQGLARIELLGAESARTVTFIRKINTRVDRFEEREVPDANLPAGVRVLTQRGIPGFHINRYRIVREGDQAVRERWTDAYPPTSQIWHVGTGAPGTALGTRPDDHPEYTADQYLALTQSPAVASIQEVRRPGFSGSAGWMVALGLTRALPPGLGVPQAAPAAPAPPARPRR